MRRILTILSIILLIASQSQAQTSRTTPVDGSADKIIKLYPNPANSYVTFDLQGNYKKGLTIHIYNGVLGKKMFEAVNMPEKLTVNLNDFNRGIYIYHLIDNTGRIVESGKFQVSH
ncbi:MAG: T9SS type A sorting domain-containing protein [Chitinophagaceae bacterium]